LFAIKPEIVCFFLPRLFFVGRKMDTARNHVCFEGYLKVEDVADLGSKATVEIPDLNTSFQQQMPLLQARKKFISAHHLTT